MYKYKTWFAVSFFWIPLGVSVLLNPGRNGRNIAGFSNPMLGALAVCAVGLVLFAVANFLPARVRRFTCTNELGSWITFCYFTFALILGLLGLISVGIHVGPL